MLRMGDPLVLWMWGDTPSPSVMLRRGGGPGAWG